MKNFEFVSHDGEKISFYLWAETKGETRGVVQILHGMSEHMERYEEFAEFLNSHGFVVVGDDHRGHGKTAGSLDKIGKAGSGDIFSKTVKDEVFITSKVKALYKDLPYIVLGHSYGSLLLQRYLEFNSRAITAAILVGTSCLKGSLDAFMGRIVCALSKKDSPAKLIKKLSFDSYDKKFGGELWITRDKEIADKYKADPRCNQIFSHGFYKSLFAGVRATYKKNELEKINNHLPILMLSGNQDKFSKDGKLVTKLYDIYTKQLGLSRVEIKLYDGARHEVLNETNRAEVYDDVLKFIESVL